LQIHRRTTLSPSQGEPLRLPVTAPLGPRVGALAVIAVLLLLLLVPAASVAAPFGNALKLDGVDDYANVADNATLDLGDTDGEDFTIESLFYVPNQTNESLDTIFYKQNAYALFINFNTASADAVFFRWWTGPLSGNFAQLSNTTNITAGWHHIAAVYDNEFTASNDRVGIYLDGAQFADNTGATDLTPGIWNSASELGVGAGNALNHLEGFIDEARFSDTVRYSASYAVPSSPFSPDASTRALWHFDEAVSSTSFADSSGNGNTLTGQNGAQTGLFGAYVRPAAAAQFRVPLAIAYDKCGDNETPNRSHSGGLTGGSCNPAVPRSSYLTVGTLDANGFNPQSGGFVKLTVCLSGTTATGACSTPSGMTAPDIRMEASMTDVRCKSGVATCQSGVLSDYTGELRATAVLRITDRHNATTAGGTGDPATVGDGAYLPFTLDCSPNEAGGDPSAIGATCGVLTRANAVIPGAIQPAKRGNWEMGPIEVLDGGADGDVETANNTTFATQGIFVP
jgi:hypothetical protein